jgi:hypothetical protein
MKHKLYRTAIVKDVGEYSIFIQKKLPKWADILSISRKGKRKWYTSQEALKTPEGIIFYFDERIDGVFKKGCIYPIRVFIEIKFYDIFKNAMTSVKMDIDNFDITNWETL